MEYFVKMGKLFSISRKKIKQHNQFWKATKTEQSGAQRNTLQVHT